MSTEAVDKREPGFYWVQFPADATWTVGEFGYDTAGSPYWCGIGSGETIRKHDLHRVGPRILPPAQGNPPLLGNSSRGKPTSGDKS